MSPIGLKEFFDALFDSKDDIVVVRVLPEKGTDEKTVIEEQLSVDRVVDFLKSLNDKKIFS